MSAQSLARVWDATGLTPEQKLVLLWVANASGGDGVAVPCDFARIGEFAGIGYLLAADTLNELAELGLIHWPEGSWVWVATEAGRYDDPWRDEPTEPRKRSARMIRIIERDGHACKYCGTEVGHFHLDHVMPRSRGGPDTLDNLVLACAKCNMSKGAKTLEEWRR